MKKEVLNNKKRSLDYKIDILDHKGNKTGETELSKEVFGVKPNFEVLLGVLRTSYLNKRQGTSSTKTRGLVSGGGKKPWRQKGTGRARVGSSRNPIWRHGGISHGPKPKVWTIELPKVIKNQALVSALSLKTSQKDLFVLEKIEIEKNKTSEAKKLLNAFPFVKGTVVSETSQRAFKNLQNVKVISPLKLNASHVFESKQVVFSKDSLKTLIKRLTKETS